MDQHPNARLTPRGRETLVSRIESGLGVAAAARQMGVSRQTASKWLRRSRSGEGLSDRGSRPRRLARSTPRDVEDRVCEALVAPACAARPLGRHRRAGAHLRQDRREAGPAPSRRRRPGHRRGPAARPRHPRALRAGEAGRARPRGRQEGREDPGRRRLEGPRGVRPRAPGLGCRLRLPARRRGRLQPRRLRGAAARRAQGHLRGVHAPRAALLRGAGPDGRAGDDRQRPGLPQRRVQRAAGGRRGPARIHEALQPVAERQGGAVEPHDCAGMAVRQGMGKRGREGVRPPGLHRAL